jgi:hypothetical protein
LLGYAQVIHHYAETGHNAAGVAHMTVPRFCGKPLSARQLKPTKSRPRALN